VEALQRADSAFSAQVLAIYLPLGEFLTRGQGAAGKAELDSAQTVQKEYWKIFWRQPEVADSIVTPSQRELVPMFASMIAIPLIDREHSQWTFGHPVTVSDKPKKVAPVVPSGSSVQVQTP
jgi:hypothetical protein